MDNQIALSFRRGTFSNGMTDQNTLAAALMSRPEIETTIRTAFSQKFLLHSFADTGEGYSEDLKPIGANIMQWGLIDKMERSPVMTGVQGGYVPGGNVRLGYGNTRFTLQFDSNPFSLGTIIMSPDTQSQCRVMSKPYQSGNGWCYELEIMTESDTAYLTDADVEVGLRWPITGSAYEEASEQGATFSLPLPMWLRNQTQIMRGQHTTTRSAASDVIVFDFDVNGKKFSSWMPWQEYSIRMMWQAYLERWAWLSRINQKLDASMDPMGANNRPVRTSAGLLQQITGANTYEYNDFTNYKILEDVLYDQMYRSQDAENKKLVLVTGQGGVRTWQTMLENKARSFNLQVVANGDFLSKVGKGNQLKTGWQFIRYEGLNGNVFDLVYNPMFDYKELYPKLDRSSGLPLRSFDMYALDFSEYGGKKNIEMYTKEANGISAKMMTWWVGGSIGPNGGGKGGEVPRTEVMRSNGVDGYTCHYLTERMLIVRNPLSCVQLRYTGNGN